MTEKPKITDEQAQSYALTFFKGLWHLACLVFAMIVGTALLLDLNSNGPSWGNLPWLVLCLWLLLRR